MVICGLVDYSACYKSIQKNEVCCPLVLDPLRELGTFAFEVTWTVQGLRRISETLRLKNWLGNKVWEGQVASSEDRGLHSMQLIGGQKPELMGAAVKTPVLLLSTWVGVTCLSKDHRGFAFYSLNTAKFTWPLLLVEPQAETNKIFFRSGFSSRWSSRVGFGMSF